MPSFPAPGIQRRWKALPGEPVGDAGDPYTGYDRFGRVERMRWVQPQEDSSFLPLVDVAWGYSPSSQKTWRKDLLAPASSLQDQHFGYDGLYQVTERQRGLLNTNTTAVGAIPAQQENFAYDETGNWQSYRQQNDGVLGIEESRVNNRSNQITQVDGSSAGVSYDKNGNMLEVPTGEGLSGPSRRLEWDAWNRLKRVYDAEDTLITEYEYDGLGRRTTETVGGVTRHFYYDDQWRSIEERLDEATTPERQYVWQPSDRWELILRDRSTEDDGTLDERLYPLKDQLDPVALCDASGAVVERYAYSAFGLPTFLNPDFTPKEDNSSSFDWNFLFHAEFADTATGWFNYGYRYYVPALGRWLSRDPIGIAGGVNIYKYTANSPPQYVDAFGLALTLNAIDYSSTPIVNNWFGATGRVLANATTVVGTNTISISDDPNNPKCKCVQITESQTYNITVNTTIYSGGLGIKFTATGYTDIKNHEYVRRNIMRDAYKQYLLIFEEGIKFMCKKCGLTSSKSNSYKPELEQWLRTQHNKMRNHYNGYVNKEETSSTRIDVNRANQSFTPSGLFDAVLNPYSPPAPQEAELDPCPEL